MALASKSQESADNMEKMTRNMEKLTQEMNELTLKTTRETVSMRIITLVTLFFLPGTFISVGSYLMLMAKERKSQLFLPYQTLTGCQTIMSTDIVQFQGSEPGSEVFRSDALKLYIYVSVPLMVLTFAGWGVIYKLETWKAEKKRRKAIEKEKSEEV